MVDCTVRGTAGIVNMLLGRIGDGLAARRGGDARWLGNAFHGDGQWELPP